MADVARRRKAKLRVHLSEFAWDFRDFQKEFEELFGIEPGDFSCLLFIGVWLFVCLNDIEPYYVSLILSSGNP